MISLDKCVLDVIHAAGDDLRKTYQRWDDLLALERLPLSEAYSEGRLSVVLKLSLSGQACHYAEYRASRYFEGAVLHLDPPDNERHVCKGGHGDHRKQQEVLVRDVHLVDGAERIVPSLVRFDLIDNGGDDGLARHLYRSTLNGCFHFLFRVPNRKLDVPARPIGPVDNLADHKIEAGSQIVNGVAEDQRDAIGDGGCHPELKDVLSSVRILLDSKTAKVSFDEGVERGIQLVDVLIGPFDL